MTPRLCETTPLTDPRARALTLAARGLVTSEIAAHLGWSVERTRSIQAQAIVALGASSKLEAVLLAIRDGLIDPSELLAQEETR